jgi:sigma-B regulation protein RsbU (phosphoserine phosphatase)
LIEGASYTSSSIQLEPEDTLLLYTDGVTEAENRSRNLFEDERLKEAFGHYKDVSLKALQDGILSTVEKFTEGASQTDDITLLLARYRGPAEEEHKTN